MRKHLLLIVLLTLLLTSTVSSSLNSEPDNDTDTDTEHHQDDQQSHQSNHHFHPINTSQFWINALIAVLLCCSAGFFSGNTVGLLSISTLDLQIQLENGTPQQQKQAETILKVVGNHHLLLSTLLLCNALAMETLPIVMHTLVPAWVAILLSTVVVLIAGQIIPQALCTGPNKLRIAEICAPYIGILIKIFWIVCYPLAKALDWMFGQHQHTRIEKKDLKNLLKLQDQNTLKKSQSFLLTSILSLRQIKVDKMMVPLKDVYMLNANSVIEDNLINQIKKNNHSFIPLYQDRRSNIICIMKTKELALACFDQSNHGKRLSKVIDTSEGMLSLYQDTNLLEILMLFEDKAQKVALVVNQKRKITPGLQSIYYSKSDMVYNKQDKTEILGIILLHSIFESIASYKIGHQGNPHKDTAPSKKQIQMSDLNKPLLH